MGLSKVLPFHSLLLFWYVLPDGATSEYCVKDSESESVEYCSWSCCGSEFHRYCCMSPYVIAGIVFGCIACVCTLVSVVFCLCQYKKQRGQVISYPQSQRVVVLSGNVPQQQHNGYTTSFSGYNTQYNATPPPPYTHQAKYPSVPPAPPAYTAATSPPPAYTYNAPPSNPFAVAANQAAGRTPTAK